MIGGRKVANVSLVVTYVSTLQIQFSILKVSGVVFHALIEDGQQLTVHIVMSM